MRVSVDFNIEPLAEACAMVGNIGVIKKTPDHLNSNLETPPFFSVSSLFLVDEYMVDGTALSQGRIWSTNCNGPAE